MQNNSNLPSNEEVEKKSTLLKLFNYLGGALIFLGIAYFISSSWGMLNNFVKIFSTLGCSICAYLIGLLLMKSNKYPTASSTFYMLSALLLPVGIAVTYQIYNIAVPSHCANLSIWVISFGVFLLSQLRWPRTIFLLFSIIFGSLFYSCVIECYILNSSLLTNQYRSLESILQCELISLGLSYVFLGLYLNANKTINLVGPLYCFGALFILVGTYFLNFSFTPFAIQYWKIIPLITIILTLLFSIPLKSKSFLYLGVIFLISYILEMSTWFAETFGNLGWSLILVLAGLFSMALGYLVFFIHKKITSVKLD